jgi:hypothetical protein
MREKRLISLHLRKEVEQRYDLRYLSTPSPQRCRTKEYSTFEESKERVQYG